MQKLKSANTYLMMMRLVLKSKTLLFFMRIIKSKIKGNNSKKVDSNIDPEATNDSDPSDNLICLLGATSVTTAKKSTPKHLSKRKSYSIKKGVSSSILEGNGSFRSSPLPPLSSLITTNSLSSGASSSSESFNRHSNSKLLLPQL